MCGRYGLNTSPTKLKNRFNVPAVPELPFDGHLQHRTFATNAYSPARQGWSGNGLGSLGFDPPLG